MESLQTAGCSTDGASGLGCCMKGWLARRLFLIIILALGVWVRGVAVANFLRFFVCFSLSSKEKPRKWCKMVMTDEQRWRGFVKVKQSFRMVG